MCYCDFCRETTNNLVKLSPTVPNVVPSGHANRRLSFCTVLFDGSAGLPGTDRVLAHRHSQLLSVPDEDLATYSHNKWSVARKLE